MKLSYAERQSVNQCCTPDQALAWLEAVIEMALDYGDEDAARMIPEIVAHWLEARR